MLNQTFFFEKLAWRITDDEHSPINKKSNLYEIISWLLIRIYMFGLGESESVRIFSPKITILQKLIVISDFSPFLLIFWAKFTTNVCIFLKYLVSECVVLFSLILQVLRKKMSIQECLSKDFFFTYEYFYRKIYI